MNATTEEARRSGEVAIYREEALRHRGCSPDDVAPLAEAPRWVGLLFWLLVAGVALSAVAAGAVALRVRAAPSVHPRPASGRS